jgi:hypothetical protein
MIPGQVLWFTPIVLAFRKQRQGNGKMKASLGHIERPCLNKPKLGVLTHTCNPRALETEAEVL